MKTTTTLATLAAMATFVPAALMAQDAQLDTNMDGVVTYDEAAMAMPDLTEDAFMQMDANSDGVLDADELAMARDGGMLPDGAAAPDAG